MIGRRIFGMSWIVRAKSVTAFAGGVAHDSIALATQCLCVQAKVAATVQEILSDRYDSD